MLPTTRLTTFITAILMLALGALACNLPGSQTSPEKSTQPPAEPTLQIQQPSQTPLSLPTGTPLPDVQFEGISFSYDKSLAQGVKTAIIPASQYSDAPIWATNPEFYEIELDGYLLPEHFHKPVVQVFSIEKYQQVTPEVDKTITSLKGFLSQCPQRPENIPFLPYWNAAQILQTKVSCLDFKNGRGVRFVTQYGQDISPINNYGLFYTFQGLTTDEKYYVSVVLPTTQPDLPPNGDNPPGGWETFSNQYTKYIADIETQIDQYPDESFHPTLILLDDLIKSLEIKPGV